MKSWFSSLLGRSEAAAEAAPAAATLADSPEIDALITAGNELEDAGNPTEALVRYQQARQLAPGSARVHLNIGNAQKLLKDLPAAVASFRKAVELDASNAPAHLNLGNALFAQQSHVEAQRSYRVALLVRPDWPDAMVGLACALEETGGSDEAVALYKQVLAISPGHAGAAYNLSVLKIALGDGQDARQYLIECLKHTPGNKALMFQLAEVERNAGRISEGISNLRNMVDHDPDHTVAHGIYLYNLNFLTTVTPEEIVQAHRRFGDLMESRIAAMRLPWPAKLDPDRRLRVAYVSPDFRRHAVANFVVPILRHHDRSQVEVFGYFVSVHRDEVTDLIEGLVDQWRMAAEWSDEALANAIRDDKIDILVDLTGHTSGNRIAVFAHKPAPVQIAWLGYPATTGLSRIDYRLCDQSTDPAGVADAYQTERAIRMPDTQWCYEELTEIPPPAPLPRLKNGYWTFVSANNSRKLNESVFQAWAAILKAFPDSRLRLYRLQPQETAAWVVGALSDLGIAPERLEIVGFLPRDRYFHSFADVDIALDSFPYNGTTTTCESLLMGLPVLTVAGDRSVSRVGISMLNAVGLPEWIADSENEFAELAKRLLADVDAIARLRAELPGRMRAGPLMDAPRFTRNLEECYRQAWERWCEQPRRVLNFTTID